MNRLFAHVLVIFLVLALAFTTMAQTPEIDAKKKELDEVRAKMADATPEEYESLKAQFDKLSAEISTLVKQINVGAAEKREAQKLVKEAFNLINKNRYSQAEENCLAASQKDPLMVQAQYYLGMAREKQGNSNGAVEAYEAAIGINGNYAPAYIGRGRVLANGNSDDRAKALEVLQKVSGIAQAKPSHKADAAILIGNIYRKDNKFEQAINAYTEAAMHEESNDLAYYYLGICNRDKNSPDLAAAAENLQKACNLKSKKNYWYELAKTQNQRSKYNDAIKAADSAIAISAKFGKAWYEKGWALQQLGKTQDALVAYGKAKSDKDVEKAAQYQIDIINGKF